LINGVIEVAQKTVVRIAEEQSEFFSAQIWKNIEAGLPGSVHKLTELAEKA
jgi:hypothetical protein